MSKKLQFSEGETIDIINLYTIDRDNIKNISRKFGVGPKVIRRLLIENNIELDGIKNRFYRVLTKEHRDKISRSLIGKISNRNGYKMSFHEKIKNSEAQLGFQNFSLLEFNDYEKFRFIMKWVGRYRMSKKGEEYVYSFIKKIYNDDKFNTIYNFWYNNKGKWNIPTIDHIIPLSRGGDFFDLNNIQVLTWFENRAKAEMTQKEWEDFKIDTSTKSDLFI
jgi:hypothetical protein